MSRPETVHELQASNRRLFRMLEAQVERDKQQRLEGREIGWREAAIAYESKIHELGIDPVFVPNPYTKEKQ